MIVVNVITGLNDGGAEGVLCRLCLSDAVNEHIVICMTGPGKYGPILDSFGIKVFYLNMHLGGLKLVYILKLYFLFKRINPNVVQTWMYHSDLIGGLVARVSGVKNVCWNIRHSELEPGKSKRSTIWVAKACAFLSKWVPRKIICCAQKAKQVHIEYGYDASKMVVIGNGYDLDQFRPDPCARQLVRAELGISSDTLLLGKVGRFNIQKNHEGLLHSLNILKGMGIDFKCALVGADMNPDNQQLVGWIGDLELEKELLLLDQRTDIPAIMNALDIHVFSSSFGEGFPNVLAEAMACGTPCVTTNAGDAADIVGETGWVVPVNDISAFAEALLEAATELDDNSEGWSSRSSKAIDRVQQNFSLEKMVKAYHRAWDV
ncbi:MAG: glycosyltransferase [Saccharospirillum sp.]|nr:glycosyltransferase [Saccharospirillum sp.]